MYVSVYVQYWLVFWRMSFSKLMQISANFAKTQVLNPQWLCVKSIRTKFRRFAKLPVADLLWTMLSLALLVLFCSHTLHLHLLHLLLLLLLLLLLSLSLSFSCSLSCPLYLSCSCSCPIPFSCLFLYWRHLGSIEASLKFCPAPHHCTKSGLPHTSPQSNLQNGSRLQLPPSLTNEWLRKWHQVTSNPHPKSSLLLPCWLGETHHYRRGRGASMHVFPYYSGKLWVQNSSLSPCWQESGCALEGKQKVQALHQDHPNEQQSCCLGPAKDARFEIRMSLPPLYLGCF